MSSVEDVAREREALHENHASSRPLSPDYERIGLAGEWAFGVFSGLMPDMEPRPGGDGGIDFEIMLRHTVDVKTAEKAFNLIHEEAKPLTADIYVLAEYDRASGKAKLVGWALRSDLRAAPVKEFGHGIPSRYIPRDKLRRMEHLKARMGGWR